MTSARVALGAGALLGCGALRGFGSGTRAVKSPT